MTTAHIYRAIDQPATRYKVTLDLASGPWTFTVCNRRRRRFHCHTCKQVRWAAYLTAHVYYDGVYYFCKPGRGCKSKRAA